MSEEILKNIISFAKEKNCLLNPLILEKILFETNGKCLCKVDTRCPCRDASVEIEKNKKCYCGLFVKK